MLPTTTRPVLSPCRTWGTAPGQPPAQLAEVEDFAVAHDHARTVFTVDGLMARVEINDGKAAHAQPDGAVHVIARIVWTAVGEHVGHAPQHGAVGAGAVSVVKDSADATHDGQRRSE